MARHPKKTEYAYASHGRSIPPLPHRSWALTYRNEASGKLLTHEARQKFAQFWENLDI